MQIKVISFDPPTALLTQCQRLFPAADVRQQRAVDVRSLDPVTLLTNDMIGPSAFASMRWGRRWHHEVPSAGAVGVQHAVRLALEEDPTSPLLLLESDCVILDEARFVATVDALLRRSREYDMAVIGIEYPGILSSLFRADEPVPGMGKGWVRIRDPFLLLHCVIYTPSGREKVSKLLSTPLDMQIDSFLGIQAHAGRIDIWAYASRDLAKQSVHLSSIQTIGGDFAPIVAVALGVVIALAAVIRVAQRRRGKAGT